MEEPMSRTGWIVGVAVGASLLMTCFVVHGATPRADAEREIPFVLGAGDNILVEAVLNETDPCTLMLHTAATDVFLTEEAVRKAKSVEWTGAGKLTSWGGESNSRLSANNLLQIGTLQWAGIKVWEDKHTGFGADGKFGLDLFDGRVVEIDFDRQRIATYEAVPAKAAKYQRLKLESSQGDHFITADCVVEGAPHRNRFLIHTGYCGGLLLDDDFVTKTGIDGQIEVDKETSMQDSFGKTLKVKNVTLPAIVIGDVRMERVPSGFFSGAIGRQKKSIMGMAVLKQLNLIFDIANESLYVSRRQ
jgi:predicted aspartyl protease